MRRLLSAAILPTLLLAGFAANAQSTRPGLWEVTSKLSGNAEVDAAMAEMHKQMAAMPPEQRKMMEGMLARQGMSMPGASSDGVTIKVCVTPEMAERLELPRQTEGDCSTEILSRSASSMNVRFACKNPESSGEGRYTFTSDTAYSMHMAMRATHNGKVQNTTIDGKGKWLGKDCGAVKPAR